MAFQSRTKSSNVNSFVKPQINTYTTTNVVRPINGDVDFNQYMNLNSQGTSIPPSQNDFVQFRNQYQVPVLQNTSRPANDSYWTQSIPPSSNANLIQQRIAANAKGGQIKKKRKKNNKKKLSSVSIFKKNIKEVTKELFNKKNKKISLYEHIYRTCSKNNRSESLGILFIIILLILFIILLFVYKLKQNRNSLQGGLTTSKTNPFKKYF